MTPEQVAALLLALFSTSRALGHGFIFLVDLFDGDNGGQVPILRGIVAAAYTSIAVALFTYAGVLL